MNAVVILSLALLIVIGLLGLVSTLLLSASIIVLFLVGVPFVPTPKKNIEKIFEVLDLKPGQVFYDIGCGDGRFVIQADKKGAKAIGFEISPIAWLRSKINIFINKSKAQVKFKNFYSQNLSDADAVFCFLLDPVMPKVEKKLLPELKPGAKVVSYGFTMPNWQLKKLIETSPGNKKSSKIYLYIKE